jgi:predicted amino acid racemase
MQVNVELDAMSKVTETKLLIKQITPKGTSKVKEALNEIGIGGISQSRLQELIRVAVDTSIISSQIPPISKIPSQTSQN